MIFLVIVLATFLVTLLLYASGWVPAFTVFVDSHLTGSSAEQKPASSADKPAAAASKQVVPTSTVYVPPDTSCNAPIDCTAASNLALDHYVASAGALPGAKVSSIASAADPLACNYKFVGTKTVNVPSKEKPTIQLPYGADERRFVFVRDDKTCAATKVNSMGEAGSGFMVENAIRGTLSLGGMCATPQGGKTSNGVPVELQLCDAYAPAQLWEYDSSTSQIHPQADMSYCLDVTNVSRNNGAKVQLWSCNETPGQVSSYDEVKGEVRSGIRPGFCLEAPGGKASKGMQLGMWDCNGFAPAQRFATTLFR